MFTKCGSVRYANEAVKHYEINTVCCGKLFY